PISHYYLTYHTSICVYLFDETVYHDELNCDHGMYTRGGAGRPSQASDAVRVIPNEHPSRARSRDKIVQQLRRAEPLPVLGAVHEIEVAGVAVQEALLFGRHGPGVVAVLQAQRQRHAAAVVAAAAEAAHVAVRHEPRVAVVVRERVLQEAAAAVADGAEVEA